MHAMILDENRNFKWCEIPDPVRKTGEILIEVHAAAVEAAAEPIEIVDLIMYICSDRGSFITGCNYMIDGGRSCAMGNFL